MLKYIFRDFSLQWNHFQGSKLPSHGGCYSIYPDNYYNTHLRKAGSRYSNSSERKAKSLKDAPKRSQSSQVTKWQVKVTEVDTQLSWPPPVSSLYIRNGSKLQVTKGQMNALTCLCICTHAHLDTSKVLFCVLINPTMFPNLSRWSYENHIEFFPMFYNLFR